MNHQQNMQHPVRAHLNLLQLVFKIWVRQWKCFSVGGEGMGWISIHNKDTFLPFIFTLFKSVVSDGSSKNVLPKSSYKTYIYNVRIRDDSFASKYDFFFFFFVFSVTRNAKTILLDPPKLSKGNVMHGFGMRMQNIPGQEYNITNRTKNSCMQNLTIYTILVDNEQWNKPND